MNGWPRKIFHLPDSLFKEINIVYIPYYSEEREHALFYKTIIWGRKEAQAKNLYYQITDYLIRPNFFKLSRGGVKADRKKRVMTRAGRKNLKEG